MLEALFGRLEACLTTRCFGVRVKQPEPTLRNTTRSEIASLFGEAKLCPFEAKRMVLGATVGRVS